MQNHIICSAISALQSLKDASVFITARSQRKVGICECYQSLVLVVFGKSQSEEGPVSQPRPQHLLCLFWAAAGPPMETGRLKVDGWFWNIYCRAGRGGVFASPRISLLNSARRQGKIHQRVYHIKLGKLALNRLPSSVKRLRVWKQTNKQTNTFYGAPPENYQRGAQMGTTENLWVIQQIQQAAQNCRSFYVLLSDRIYQQWVQWISGSDTLIHSVTINVKTS